MKYLFMAGLIWLSYSPSWAQRTIRDRHITNQQERMVFKQWSRSRFTPTSGFLGLNPNYLLTWAWHPNYPDNDLRPLGHIGPQSQRLALAAAMQQTDNVYKLHADTLSNTAISEAVNYSAAFSKADPLWQLYYRHELGSLLDQQDEMLFDGIPLKEAEYLVRTGVYQWYRDETAIQRERLEGVMETTIDRGSRIMAYHRMMLEYRKLNASWDAKKQYARKFLALVGSANKIKSRDQPITASGYRSDIQIANDILSRSKL
ncbi:MAG: hypothetical protein EOO20_00390 [Chryseobacterium sp.]|nr:MAG: hypothetical protein EOO20_00390 [Chryseobacterium sp.]